MNRSPERLAGLSAKLEEAVLLERRLAARLEDQADRLRRGAVDEIHAATAALDAVRVELVDLGADLKRRWAEIAGPDAPLSGLLDALPEAERERYREARDRARWSGRKNAVFARAAIDVIAELKSCVVRAAGAGTDGPGRSGIALDARA